MIFQISGRGGARPPFTNHRAPRTHQLTNTMLAVLTAAVMTSLHIRSSPRLRVAAVPAMSAQEELDLATVTADLEAALERARRLLRSRDERRSGVCWRPACSAG